MDRIKFKVNGVEHTVGCEVSSDTTLLEYLRRKLELRGTKYMCNEAGCGACIVSAVKSLGEAPQSVNACMISITSCQDWDITTIEKVGNRLDGYHPLQTTLAAYNGSQCGHCTPGWIMAFYSLLQSKKLTMLEIEQSFGSNVCRCTGYRPILQAFKKFASDAPVSAEILDIEDLKICDKTGEACSNRKCEEDDWCVISKDEILSRVIRIKLSDNKFWFRVETLVDIFNIFHDFGTESYMLVAGNTGKGAYPILEYPNILIDISSVSELKGYYLDQNLVVGANNTLTNLLDIFTIFSHNEYFSYFKVLRRHLVLVAHIPVRNLGTIAGNLILKNMHPEFQSDIFLLLETVGAQLTLLTAPGVRKIVTMLEFLKEDMRGKVILNVLFPPLNSNEYKCVTYKIMPRSQNAHALLHAGFLYKLNKDNQVLESRIVYGNLSAFFIRAYNTEKYLVNKMLFTNDTLQGAVKVLDQEMVVTEMLPEPPALYRRKIALGLFYKGLLTLCPINKMSPRYYSGPINLHDTRPVSNAKQTFETNPVIWPLNQPIPRIEGLLQCAGETFYTEDLPTLPREVFAVFVTTTVPLGTINNIDPTRALKEPGVIAFYGLADLPGKNSFTTPGDQSDTADEEFLCDGEVKYFNQPLGIIVAESHSIAIRAAKMVEVQYSNVRKPIIDVKEAKHFPSRVSLVRAIDATDVGKDVFKVIKGEHSIYAQYYFPMETQVCVTHPIEEGLKVYISTQWIDAVHTVISRGLKLDQNRIDVYVRRLGGAYGFKVSRANQIALACSLVVYKLNRPCRFINPLRSNTRVYGKRFPSSSTFEVAVDKRGVIQYMDYELYSDNGYIINEPLILVGVDVYNNCYKKDTWNFKVFNTITDTASNTWCRAPGTLENIAMAETIMERISYEINQDALEVRLANLDEVYYSDMMEVINTIKDTSQYEERRKNVYKFNSENRWKKRGLRFSIMRWSPTGSLYLEITLNVYRDDGTVAITHGGIEMGQGVNTRAIQTAAYYLQIPVEKIQVKPNDNIKSPNNCATIGSITSLNVATGVRRCCEELLVKLAPVRAQMDNPTWEQLINMAFKMEIDLQTHTLINSKDTPKFEVYGATLTEVEIDVLTGQWEIIRVDLIEDAGRSINPELDVGQVEGAFTMGVGYWTTEHLVYHPDTGELLTDRTWDYWVPQARDIPQDFRVHLRRNSYSSDYILGAKGVGEPATCMGVSVSFALREAISAARLETGIPTNIWFQLDGPFTVDRICGFCETRLEDFKFI